MCQLISSPAGGDPAPVPAGNDDPGDDQFNNLVATGALYAVLYEALRRGHLTGVEHRVGTVGNTLDVRLGFLRSPYRLTIERVPDDEAGAEDG